MMRNLLFPAATLMALLLGSCCDGLPKGPDPGMIVPTGTDLPKLGLFALKASNGSYVTCSTAPDSSGHVLLYANKPSVGPNEVFTAEYTDNGLFGIKAPNGKIVTADRNQGNILIADRDYVGEWERFELVNAADGKFAFKNSNGQFIGAHHEIPATSQLIADKAQASDWEFFTVERDPAIGQ